MQLKFTIKSSFFNEINIIDSEATFEDNSDMDIKVRQTKSRAKETQWKQDLFNSQIHLAGQAHRSKCPCVRYESQFLTRE